MKGRVHERANTATPRTALNCVVSCKFISCFLFKMNVTYSFYTLNNHDKKKPPPADSLKAPPQSENINVGDKKNVKTYSFV